MAYARMGTSYSSLTRPSGQPNLQRAYELRKRVSEREEFYIAEHYEIFVTGNLETARQVDELSAQTYPRDTPFTIWALSTANWATSTEPLRRLKTP